MSYPINSLGFLSWRWLHRCGGPKRLRECACATLWSTPGVGNQFSIGTHLSMARRFNVFHLLPLLCLDSLGEEEEEPCRTLPVTTGHKSTIVVLLLQQSMRRVHCPPRHDDGSTAVRSMSTMPKFRCVISSPNRRHTKAEAQTEVVSRELSGPGASLVVSSSFWMFSITVSCLAPTPLIAVLSKIRKTISALLEGYRPPQSPSRLHKQKVLKLGITPSGRL